MSHRGSHLGRPLRLRLVDAVGLEGQMRRFQTLFLSRCIGFVDAGVGGCAMDKDVETVAVTAFWLKDVVIVTVVAVNGNLAKRKAIPRVQSWILVLWTCGC